MFMRFRKIATVVVSFAIGRGFSQTKSEQPLSGFRISGRVVDQSGAPIAGQVVNFRIVDSGSLDVVKTGEDGRFAFTFDGNSPYELYAPVKDSPAFKLITIVVADRDLDLLIWVMLPYNSQHREARRCVLLAPYRSHLRSLALRPRRQLLRALPVHQSPHCT